MYSGRQIRSDSQYVRDIVAMQHRDIARADGYCSDGQHPCQVFACRYSKAQAPLSIRKKARSNRVQAYRDEKRNR